MNGTAVSQQSTSSKMKQEIVDLTENDDEVEVEDKYSYPLSQYESDYEEEEDEDQNQNNSSSTNPRPLSIKQEKEGKEIAKISNLVSLSNSNDVSSMSSTSSNSSSSAKKRKVDNGIKNLREHQKEQEVEMNPAVGETVFVNQFTLYKCALCPFRFDTVEDLNRHIDSNQHRPESMACCLVCAKSVPSRLLQSHLKNHAGARKPHPCPHPSCVLTFHRFEEWRNHILVHDFVADGSRPIPVARKQVSRTVSNRNTNTTKRRIEKVDKNDPRIISTQLTISGKRNRVTPYSVLPSTASSSSSFSSTFYSCPICRQHYRMKSHLELHIAQAHGNNNNMINSTTTSNQGGRPVIFATAQPPPQPRYALIINQPGTNHNDNSFQKSDNNPVCPHCKAVFISEEYFKTHLDHCTMKGQGTLLNGFGGGGAKLVQLPPQVQKPRQVIFVPRSHQNNNNNSVGLSSSLPYGSQQQQQQQRDVKIQPIKIIDPPGRKIGILRKTIR